MQTRTFFKASLTLTVAVVGFTASMPAVAASLYTLTDLGTLGGSRSEAFGINNIGQIVGQADTDMFFDFGSPVSHAFLYNGGPLKDLGTLGGTFSTAQDINKQGQVVGYSDTASGFTHGFRTAANKAINPTTDDLGTLGGFSSLAYGINNQGQVSS